MNVRRLVAAPRSGAPIVVRSLRRAANVALLAAVVGPLAACGGSDLAPASPTPAATTPEAVTPPAVPDPSATPVGGFGNDRIALGPVTWSLAIDPGTGGPADAVTAIPEDSPRFWAAAPLVRATPGVRLRADWTYNGTAMPVLAAETVVPDVGGGWVTFDLALPKDERWPVGDYAVTISVDGQPAMRATIPVVAAES